MVNLCEITEKLESAYPLSYACSWDNVGLLVGNRDKKVSKVLLALDFDIEVAKEAKEVGAELIITHHPIMFSPINKITSDTPMGRALQDPSHPGGPGAVRHRPGRVLQRPARPQRRNAPGYGLYRLRHRRPLGRRAQARDVRNA